MLKSTLRIVKMSLKFVPKPCRIKRVSNNSVYSFRPMRKFFSPSSVSLASSLFLFAAVSWGWQVPSPAPVPQYADKPAVKEDIPKSPESAAAGAAVDSNTYKVGPADVLKIGVWNEEKFSVTAVVQQNGKFTMPLVGDIQAGDSTPKEIEASVAKALTKYVVKPLVTVTVIEVGSKKYYLVGLVNKPGEYPLSAPTTILDALSKSGGLQDFANKKKIYVLRGDKKISFNYKEVINGNHMEQNIQLEPGDHVIVP